MKKIPVLFTCIFALAGLVNASNTGKITGSGSSQNDFNKPPRIIWTFSSDTSFFASPVTEAGVVFAGSLDSCLYAVDLESGTERWRFKTQGKIRSQVLVNGNRLFLNGGDGVIYCLAPATGKLLWKFRNEGEKHYDFADYFHSSPVIQDGVVYVGSGDSHVYALDPGTGRRIWKFRTGGIVHSTPAVEKGTVFFGSFDGYVYAVDARSGQMKWKFKTVGHRYFPAGEVQGSPVLFDGKVFIGARDYNVYALDQKKGFCHWNKAFQNGWGLSTAILDSVLYIGTADERCLISADPATGAEDWRIKMEFLVFGQPAETDSLVYSGTTIGKVHAISKKTGQKVWSFETESYQKYRSSYFKSDDSYRDDIYSIIHSNEHFLQVECQLGGIFTTPVITGDYLLVTSANGKLYCLKR